MPKVLIADEVAEDCVRILRAGDIEVDVRGKMKPDELAALIGGYEGLVVRSATKVTAPAIAAAARMKVIGRAGIGVDNIDVEAASRKGIIVMNAPLGNVTSAAEHAWAILMANARNVVRGDRSLRAGQWERGPLVGVELENKVLGIVGLGKVGSQLARYAKAFQMRVLAYDPLLVKERAEVLGVELVEFDRVLAESDFISVHVPLTEKTKGLFGAREFGRMKRSARIVNTSRGGILDEKALAEALAGHVIAGAALDVFEQEPPPAGHPLFRQETLTATPHLGASTEEAQLRVSIDIAEQFVAYFRHGVVRNAVNQSSVADPSLAPFVRLADDLGALAGQIVSGKPRTVEITYMGQIAGFDTGAITQTALKGVLSTPSGGEINAVNARFRAKELGLTVTENRRKDARNFKSLLSVRVETEEGSRTVSGTIFEGGQPRIVHVDGFDIDLRPARHLLMMTYPDMPGMVGKFGTVLGSHNINIARMEVGRSGRGQQAMIIVTVDDPVPPRVLEEIRSKIQVSDIRSVTLGSE